jgi:hypothetical protein
MTAGSCNLLAGIRLAKCARLLDRGVARALALVLWILLSVRGSGHASERSAPAPLPEGVTVMDLDGKRVNPFGPALGKAAVFIFASVECPISNGYMPEYRRLADEFTPKGVVFRLVFPNQDESAEDIRKHLEAYKCAIAALRDPGHELVKVAKVRFTPEAAVFAAERGLVYHGRIDNRHEELGRTRPAATRHELHEAIEAVLHGRLPEVRATRAVGCYIAGEP